MKAVTTKRALIVFVKAPMPGEVKTRLIPQLSAEESAGLYRCFVSDILLSLNHLASTPRLTVAYQPHSKLPDLGWLGARNPPDFFRQEGNSLGERLVHGFGVAFGRGCREVVLIGSDAPTMPAAYIDQAFAALADADVVLGPALDGGYYLIGLSRPCMKLFENVAWSTDQVFESTVANAQQLNYRLKTLPPHFDIDTFDDLGTLNDDLARHPDICPQTRRFLQAIMRGKPAAPAPASR